MMQMRLWSSAAIIIAVVLIAFALSVPHTRDAAVELSLTKEPSVPAVSLKDSFRKGVHTISGSLEAPDACTTVSAEAALVEGVIVVAISTAREAGVCLELSTPTSFETTLEAPEGLPLEVTVNGVPVEITPS